jgi:hypothetical protein
METIGYAKKNLEKTKVATQHRSSHYVSGTLGQVFSKLFVDTLPQPLFFPVYKDSCVVTRAYLWKILTEE